jgi:hypothetical protein
MSAEVTAITREALARADEVRALLLLASPTLEAIDDLIAGDATASTLRAGIDTGSRAHDTLRMCAFVAKVAPGAAAKLRAIVDAPDAQAQREALLAKMAAEWQALLGRQIIHPDEIAHMAANPDWLESYLKMGLGALEANTGSGHDEQLITDVLDHDKGYPRALNFASEFTPRSSRTVGSVLLGYLQGFANTDVFTGEQNAAVISEQIRAGYAAASTAKQNELWGKIFAKICMEIDADLYDLDAFIPWITARGAEVVAAFDGTLSAGDVNAVVGSAGRLRAALEAGGFM